MCKTARGNARHAACAWALPFMPVWWRVSLVLLNSQKMRTALRCGSSWRKSVVSQATRRRWKWPGLDWLKTCAQRLPRWCVRWPMRVWCADAVWRPPRSRAARGCAGGYHRGPRGLHAARQTGGAAKPAGPGPPVAMVGDGLNDGPVMAGAHVSFAFGRAVPWRALGRFRGAAGQFDSGAPGSAAGAQNLADCAAKSGGPLGTTLCVFLWLWWAGCPPGLRDWAWRSARCWWCSMPPAFPKGLPEAPGGANGDPSPSISQAAGVHLLPCRHFKLRSPPDGHPLFIDSSVCGSGADDPGRPVVGRVPRTV